MDWSLVLVSQGIEAVIDHDSENGWGLVVDEYEADRAEKVIEQYRIENTRWPWQQKVLHPQISFDWGCVPWVLLMCLFFWFSEHSSGFRDAGVMKSAAVNQGQWWRLFTAISLHADIAHLASNAGIGFVLLGLAMGRYGTGVGLLAAYLAGAAGNVMTWLVDRVSHQGLGASGMVMGALGLLAVQSVVMLKENRESRRYVIAGIAAGLMLFALTGLSPGTDVVAHFGGFVSGIAFGTLLNFLPRFGRSAVVNLLAGGIFSALVIIPWWLSLTSK